MAPYTRQLLDHKHTCPPCLHHEETVIESLCASSLRTCRCTLTRPWYNRPVLLVPFVGWFDGADSTHDFAVALVQEGMSKTLCRQESALARHWAFSGSVTSVGRASVLETVAENIWPEGAQRSQYL